MDAFIPARGFLISWASPAAISPMTTICSVLCIFCIWSFSDSAISLNDVATVPNSSFSVSTR